MSGDFFQEPSSLPVELLVVGCWLWVGVGWDGWLNQFLRGGGEEDPTDGCRQPDGGPWSLRIGRTGHQFGKIGQRRQGNSGNSTLV